MTQELNEEEKRKILEEQWLPLSESPNDMPYHLVAWELPAPDRSKPNVKGVTVGVFDYLDKKEWYRTTDSGIRIPINGATEWMPFPKPKNMTQQEASRPVSLLDWNTLSLDQMVEYLRNKYKFSSSGDAKCILHLIEFYDKHK